MKVQLQKSFQTTGKRWMAYKSVDPLRFTRRGPRAKRVSHSTFGIRRRYMKYLPALMLVIIMPPAALSQISTNSLAEDWLSFPGHSNTSADRWQYVHDVDILNRHENYTLFPQHSTNWYFCGASAVEGWSVDNCVPGIGKNTSASDAPKIASGKVAAHPGPGSNGTIGIRFSVENTGRYDLQGYLRDLEIGSGNGVRWYIDRNTNELLNGVFFDGGSNSFNIVDQFLAEGDRVYLYIDADADDAFDLAEVSFKVIMKDLFVIKTIERSSDQFVFTWCELGTNFSYTLESTSSPTSGTWMATQPDDVWPIQGNSWTQDIDSPDTHTFYRINSTN